MCIINKVGASVGIHCSKRLNVVHLLIRVLKERKLSKDNIHNHNNCAFLHGLLLWMLYKTLKGTYHGGLSLIQDLRRWRREEDRPSTEKRRVTLKGGKNARREGRDEVQHCGKTRRGNWAISEVKKKKKWLHGCSHSVHSVIDLIFVGVQAFSGVQIVAEVLHYLLHGPQFSGVRRGPSQQRSLNKGKRKNITRDI